MLFSFIFIASLAQAQMPSMGDLQGTLDSAKAKAGNVVASCTQDANNTGCTQEKDPSKLVSCMKTFRSTHPDYKLSAECQAATSTLGK
jgi:hypothetical protein